MPNENIAPKLLNENDRGKKSRTLEVIAKVTAVVATIAMGVAAVGAAIQESKVGDKNDNIVQVAKNPPSK